MSGQALTLEAQLLAFEQAQAADGNTARTRLGGLHVAR